MPSFLLNVVTAFMLFFSFLGQIAHAAESAQTERVHAQLVLHAPEGLTQESPAFIGVLLRHQPEWHTYWKHSGDSGMPTSFEWQLPPELEVGEIQWPAPQQIRVEDFLNFGYEGEVLLALPLHVREQIASEKPLKIGVRVGWLACRVECIPEEVQLSLEVWPQQSYGAFGEEFARAHQSLPEELNIGEQGVDAAFKFLSEENKDTKHPEKHLELQVRGLPKEIVGKELAFYPEQEQIFYHAAQLGRDWTQTWEQEIWHARLPLAKIHLATPENGKMSFVLGLPEEGFSVAQKPPARSWRIADAPIQGTWEASFGVQEEIPEALAAALERRQALLNESVSSEGNGSTWMLALIWGVLGGMLLNLMPCVFPVLAIKVLGVVQSEHSAKARRLSALSYTLGVVLGFAALGGLLLALRSAGEQLGWGFQLQNPWAVAILAMLFALLALNLAGAFEFKQLVPGRLASLQLSNPAADAFLSGLLVVVVASPCTAPFMGASLGFALSMPTLQALGVFIALGLGTALPFALLSWLPVLARWLPRPGAWMQTLRQAMAFPMLATVVWLVWVLGQQAGVDAASALLAVLVGLAAFIWSWGLRHFAWRLSTGALLAWLLIGVFTPQIQQTEQGALAAQSTQSHSQSQATTWQTWSPEREQELLSEGKAVFVDYTAAWCVTCQYNKHTTLSQERVLDAFAQNEVVLLRADWTRQDAQITASLQEMGRSGVPVYVLYGAGGRTRQLMSEVLSAQQIFDALAQM